MRTYPSFVDNITFYEMDSEKSQLQQKEAMLKNLTSVFNLTMNHYQDLNEMVREYLLAGREIFGLETGIVSQISGMTYTVVDVVSPLDVIQVGDEYPIEGTYCHEVFSCQKVICFPHVGNVVFMKNHPVYVNLKLEAYLSAPIEVDGELYGTLNFTSTKIRKKGFSEHERDLITLMAKAIGNFILLRDRDERLTQANTTLKKFVGYVAHDLRNPLGVIQSMAKMGMKEGTPAERIPVLFDRIRFASAGALNFVYSILDLAALGTGKLSAKLTQVPLIQLIHSAMSQLSDIQESAHAEIICQFDEQINLQVDESLMVQVFANLLMNAIKYSPVACQIQIYAEVQGEQCSISIINPIDPQLQMDSDDDRLKSIGFGLEIASECIQAHHSELNTVRKEGEYCASFTLDIA